MTNAQRRDYSVLLVKIFPSSEAEETFLNAVEKRSLLAAGSKRRSAVSGSTDDALKRVVTVVRVVATYKTLFLPVGYVPNVSQPALNITSFGTGVRYLSDEP